MMEQKFKNLISQSKRILVTSHISPDPDAVSSVLLLGTTLKLNYPEKEVVMALEEEPEGLDFLAGYKEVKFGNLLETFQKTKPDLFIMLDAINCERVSRNDGQKIRQYLKDNKVSTAIIDHHEPIGKDDTGVYIHQGSIAAVQDVYEVLYGHLKLQKPEGYGESTMLGIYSDSGGFLYKNPRHRQTFAIVSDLLEAGVDLEVLHARLNNFSTDHLKAVAEFAKNISADQDYSYSYLSDDFVAKWQTDNKPLISLNSAAGIFVNKFLRSVEGRKWGFVVYLNPLAGDSVYSVSLRSQSDVKDVSKIANDLGGGGHKPAAGARIQAKNLDEAVEKVKQVIKKSGRGGGI